MTQWSLDVHPAYDEGRNTCFGFEGIPETVQCNSAQTGVSRYCKCSGGIIYSKSF